MAGVIPEENDDDYYSSSIWRLIFSLNFIPQFISLVGFIFVVKTDSLKFHLEKGQNEQALIMIRNIYKGDAEKILEEQVHEESEFDPT